MYSKLRWLLLLSGACASIGLVWAGADRPSEFINQGSIINTRHNLTFRSATGVDLLSGESGNPQYNSGGAGIMGWSNNYLEVCVYCHTPHGANTNVAAPLWNRNIPSTTYTTYDKLNTTTLTQAVAQPGAASLPCLSCHDGQQAIDAIMNMPGSGGYSANPDNAFLTTWYAFSGGKSAYTDVHPKMSTDTSSYDSCLVCHQPGGFGSLVAPTASDFAMAAIGTDLRNDHPVGVTYPATNGAGTDWKTPNGIVTRGVQTTTFFDENINTRMDKTEIRMYDSGNGASVECASCHDPHGVPSAGVGSKFNPTFLRKTNQGSAVCLTCHAK